MTRPIALVTGASSGIGVDLARELAKNGHDVVLVARTEAKLNEVAAELRKLGATAHVIVADLAKPNAAVDVADQLKRRSIDIDVLVNNAGYGVIGAFAETDMKSEVEMIQVNITALIQLTKLLLPPMIARKRGRILNVASTAAFQPGPYMSIYYATKAFVLSFSEAIADELRNSGVTVTALCPGPTQTGFADAAKMTHVKLFTMKRPMSSKKVAEIGYRAMMSGQRVAIAGLFNKIGAQSIRFTPRRMVTSIVRRLNV